MMINTHPNTFADTTDSIYASVAVGSDLFIVVNNPLSGSDLLISSNGKTGLVKTFDSLDSSTLTEFGNKLYFSAVDANGCTLWESDGTPSGTAMVKDTDPSSTSSSNCPEKLTVVGSIGFFTGYDSTNGEALWKTDGTTAGTVMVKDTYTTGMTNGPASNQSWECIILLWLRQHCRGSLWKSDGTTAGTVMVKDTHTSSTGWGPAKLTEVGTALYFVGFDTSSGYALWRSDGTTGGTVRDIDSSSLYNAPQDLVAFQMVFFSGYDSNNGWALWKSDGTYFGTVMVKDTYSPSPQSTEPRPEYLTVVEIAILLIL